MSQDQTLNKVVSLCKRRGFIFPGSEIYGGLANTYDFGPYGVELLRNITNFWWDHFVTKRENLYGLDSSILMSPKVWEASGHTQNFSDVLIDCKSCKTRTRADHVIENYFQKHSQDKKVEGLSEQELTNILNEHKINCPTCGNFNWTSARKFNLLFQTQVGILPDNQAMAYLRGEIAQGMFVNFKNILNTIRPRLPFGLAQTGKAFRNEITLGNFIFRTLEFNLAEFEYFFDPSQSKPDEIFEFWKQEMWDFAQSLGLNPTNLRWRTHTDEERSHYSSRTEDLDFNFPFGGFKEMFGLAYRSDYDLKNHSEKSGVDLQYTDPNNPTRKFIPHVVEPTFGLNRIFLAILCDALYENNSKLTLRIKPKLAPIKVAVFPLLANKPELITQAKKVLHLVQQSYSSAWDDRGNIGKRYFAQDEIGTPFCVTVDFQTLSDHTVTVRERDTSTQTRVNIDKLVEFVNTKLN